MTLHSAVLTQGFLSYPREKSAFHISPWNTNVHQAWLSQQGQLLQTLAAAFSGSVTEPALICPCQHSPDKGNALPFRKNAKVWPTSLPPISSSVSIAYSSKACSYLGYQSCMTLKVISCDSPALYFPAVIHKTCLRFKNRAVTVHPWTIRSNRVIPSQHPTKTD